MMAILLIGISIFALFILPFFLLAKRLFSQTNFIFQGYIGTVIGLFTSVGLAYLLSLFRLFDKDNFLLAYLLVIGITNWFLLRRLPRIKLKTKPRLSSYSWLIAIALLFGGFMRFYDPITHLSLGTNDFYYHFYSLKEVLEGGVFTAYPKAYHIIIALIYWLSGVDSYTVARFAGAVWGTLSIISVFCLIWYFENEIAGIIGALIYSSFIGVKELIIQGSGLFPTGLALFILPAIIVTAIELVSIMLKKGAPESKTKLIFVTFLLALLALESLVSPYVTLQTTYLLFLLLLIVLVRPEFRRTLRLKAIILLPLFSSGIIFVLAYYFLLEKIAKFSLRLQVQLVRNLIAGGKSEIVTLFPNIQFIFLDLVSLKPPFPSLIKFLLIIISFLFVFVLLISEKKKWIFIAFLVGWILFFGFSYTTGIFELSAYRFRSGWIYLLGMVLGIAIFATRMKYIRNWMLIATIMVCAISLVNPPLYKRNSYYEDVNLATLKIIKEYPLAEVVFYTLYEQERPFAIATPIRETSLLFPEGKIKPLESLQEISLSDTERENSFIFFKKEDCGGKTKLYTVVDDLDRLHQRCLYEQDILKKAGRLIENLDREMKIAPYFESKNLMVYRIIP